VVALREARAEPVAGGLRRRSAATEAADLRRQAREIKAQLAAFGKAAREFHRRLDVTVPEVDVEAMRTPAANLLGTLECLIGDDLKPLFKKLDELIALLNDRSVAAI
jgi:hypothetical protein